MTTQEAQHILGLRTMPRCKTDLEAAFKKALVAAQGRLSYAAAGSDRQPYLDEIRKVQEAHDLLAQALGAPAPSMPTPTAPRLGGKLGSGQPGIPRPWKTSSPRSPMQQSTQQTTVRRPSVQSSGQATATKHGSTWRVSKLRPASIPRPNLRGVLTGVLTLFRYGWAVILAILYALAYVLRFLGRVLAWIVRTVVRIPPAVTAAVILVLVVGATGWWGTHWWQDNKPLLQVATLPSSDAFVDGAALGFAPSSNAIIVSSGIHKIRCVSRFGPSTEFWVLLLPGRRYQVTVNLETEERSIHSSKVPSDKRQGRLRSWIAGWTQPKPTQGR